MYQIRTLETGEQEKIERLARSRTAPARSVERAKILWHSAQGQTAPEIARQLGVSEKAVRKWIVRFNEQGIDGLNDRPRPGRPATYPPEQVAEVIATALTKPEALGQPFACWTLDRLQAYLNEEKGIPIKRNRIDELLIREGLRWRKQETWFGERIDPAFAEKRGSSSGCTWSRPRVRS